MSKQPISFNLHRHSKLRSKFSKNQPDEMVKIPSGRFDMGSTKKTNEQPIHTVELSSFWMDIKPVTVGQFRKFIEDTQREPPSWNHITVDSPTNDHPVIYISWSNAMDYAEWIGKRLPTEAEWEYAARGGLKEYTLGKAANFYGQKKMTNVAGEYAPNSYGLYDTQGNVWEWCLDAYFKDAYSSSKRVNPVVLPENELHKPQLLETDLPRVVRGGSWNNYAPAMNVSFRTYQPPNKFYDYNGFRCVMDIES